MKISWKNIPVLFLVLLSACSGLQKQPAPTAIDPIAVFTSAVQTVSAQLTQTAQAMPTPTWTSTPEPSPVATQPIVPAETFAVATLPPAFATQPILLASPTAFPLATSGGPLCDNAIFIKDVTIPDGTKLKPGEQFKKIWRIQNTGVCTWDDGYSLVYSYGDGRLGGNGFSINSKAEFTAPGEILDIGMMMTAPEKPGIYGSCWQMRNDRDIVFGTPLCVNIEVVKK